jgi:hypothetical protein
MICPDFFCEFSFSPFALHFVQTVFFKVTDLNSFLLQASSSADNAGLVGNTEAVQPDSLGSKDEGINSEGDLIWPRDDDANSEDDEELYKEWEICLAKKVLCSRA